MGAMQGIYIIPCLFLEWNQSCGIFAKFQPIAELPQYWVCYNVLWHWIHHHLVKHYFSTIISCQGCILWSNKVPLRQQWHQISCHDEGKQPSIHEKGTGWYQMTFIPIHSISHQHYCFMFFQGIKIPYPMQRLVSYVITLVLIMLLIVAFLLLISSMLIWTCWLCREWEKLVYRTLWRVIHGCTPEKV